MGSSSALRELLARSARLDSATYHAFVDWLSQGQTTRHSDDGGWGRAVSLLCHFETESLHELDRCTISEDDKTREMSRIESESRRLAMAMLVLGYRPPLEPEKMNWLAAPPMAHKAAQILQAIAWCQPERILDILLPLRNTPQGNRLLLELAAGDGVLTAPAGALICIGRNQGCVAHELDTLVRVATDAGASGDALAMLNLLRHLLAADSVREIVSSTAAVEFMAQRCSGALEPLHRPLAALQVWLVGLSVGLERANWRHLHNCLGGVQTWRRRQAPCAGRYMATILDGLAMRWIVILQHASAMPPFTCRPVEKGEMHEYAARS